MDLEKVLGGGTGRLEGVRDTRHNFLSDLPVSPAWPCRSCWTQTLIWSAINSPCEKQQKVYAGLQFSVLTEWKSFLSPQHSLSAGPAWPRRTTQTNTSHLTPHTCCYCYCYCPLVSVMNENYRKSNVSTPSSSSGSVLSVSTRLSELAGILIIVIFIVF